MNKDANMFKNVRPKLIESLYNQLNAGTREMLDKAVDKIVYAKLNGKKIVVVVGSGPNIHEGVTTLLAHFISKGIIDGVTTSSAVVSHEMAGALEKVKRVDYQYINNYVNNIILPLGNKFELSIVNDAQLDILRQEMSIDDKLITSLKKAPGDIIIKAAGNMGYPLGLRNEVISSKILKLAKHYRTTFEYVAGLAADEKTMIGSAAKHNIPLLVSVPQLIGGGSVGMGIADCMPISVRSFKIANILEDADIIIESAVALTQEIHDGPFETYTGHGIWSAWSNRHTYSLKNKTIIRIDLDSNIMKAYQMERNKGLVQSSIDKGLPKTKVTEIPFRMEMSAFARLKNSIPIVGDIGIVWPILAYKVCKKLNIPLEFISYPQQTIDGKIFRDYIVENVSFLNFKKLENIERKV